MSLTDNQVIRALCQTRHREDICIPECKTGPSQNHFHRRIDLWTMKRSWSRPLICAYEVKVSRSDFQQDKKWHEYLQYCHQFFWACPWGLIQPEEVSGDAGLIWVTQTGSRCVMKKKAAHRKMDGLPDTLVSYILFSRCSFKKEIGDGTRDDRIEFWKHWLGQKHEAKELGRQVSRHIRQTVDEAVTKVERRHEELDREIQTLKQVRDFVVNDLGVSEKELSNYYNRVLATAQQRLKAASAAVPPELVCDLGYIKGHLERALAQVEDAKTILNQMQKGDK